VRTPSGSDTTGQTRSTRTRPCDSRANRAALRRPGTPGGSRGVESHPRSGWARTAGASSGRCRGLAVGGPCRCAGVGTPAVLRLRVGRLRARVLQPVRTSQPERRPSSVAAGPSRLDLLGCESASSFPWPCPTGPAKCPPGRRYAPSANTPRRSAWTRCGCATISSPVGPPTAPKASTRVGRSWPRWRDDAPRRAGPTGHLHLVPAPGAASEDGHDRRPGQWRPAHRWA
jgi:hypothetical protein